MSEVRPRAQIRNGIGTEIVVEVRTNKAVGLNFGSGLDGRGGRVGGKGIFQSQD